MARKMNNATPKMVSFDAARKPHDGEMMCELRERRQCVRVWLSRLALGIGAFCALGGLLYCGSGSDALLVYILSVGWVAFFGNAYLAYGLWEAIQDLNDPFRYLIHSGSDSEDRRLYVELTDRYNDVRWGKPKP